MLGYSHIVPSYFRRLARTWIDHLAFERKLRRRAPVLVYQMGKVGSLSLHQSLTKQYAGAVVHAHRFAADHPDSQVRRLHRWVFAESRPLHVISLTREPVSRNVSAFFQCFQRETGVAPRDATFSIDELKAIFLEKYDHEVPLEWFDRNILASFGIDVYAAPFPDEGICTYMRNNIRLLVMRSETNDSAKERAIGAFLGLSFFQLQNTNVGDSKDYADLYRAFKEQAKLPEQYIQRMRASRYFQHFYGRISMH